MLCVARVNLQDWPEGQVRDVDPEDEGIVGKLRGGFLAPLTRVRPDSPPSVDEAPEQTAVTESADEEQPKRRRKPA